MTKIILGLSPTFDHFASAWESTPESERTRENLTSRLRTEKSRLKNRINQETTALASKAQHNKPRNDKPKYLLTCCICYY